MIVPGPAGYSYNKVAVAVTDFNYQFCLKRCDPILFTWNKLLPSRFNLTDLLLWQHGMSFEEPNDPRSSEIDNNQIQRTELAMYDERTPIFRLYTDFYCSVFTFLCII